MHKKTAAVFLSFALGIPAALAQTTPSPTPTASPSPGTAQTTVEEQLEDTRALNFIHHTNQKEITLSQAALPKLTAQSVRDYAQRLITEHEANEARVTTVAGQENVTLAAFQPSTYEAQVTAVLNTLSGPAFDRAFLEVQIAGHQSALNELNLLQGETTDPEVQALIAETIPAVQAHLQEANALLNQLPAQTSGS